jgi:hypothetical protein
MNILLKALTLIVTGPKARMTGYQKPELLRSFVDECGNVHRVYRGGTARDVAGSGHTIEGNRSTVVTALGNNTWDVHSEDWDNLGGR